MIIFKILTQYLFVFFLVLVLIQIIGIGIKELLFKHIKINGTFTKLFFNSLIGSIISVFIYSIIKSDFHTVNVLFFIIFLFFILHFKVKINYNFKNLFKFPYYNKLTIRYLVLVVFLITIIFLLFIIEIFSFKEFPLKTPHWDYVFYSKICDGFIMTGNENYFKHLNLISNDYSVMQPYHYYGLWFNSLITETFNLNSLITLISVTLPVFITISFLGIISIFEHYNKVSIKNILISFFCLFIGAININYLIEVRNGIHYDIFSSGKLIEYYPFVFASILLLLNSHKSPSIIILLSLCIVSISPIPGIIPAIFILSAYLFYKKNISLKETIELYIYSIIFVSSFFVLYYIINSNGNNVLSNKIYAIDIYYIMKNYTLNHLSYWFNMLRITLNNFIIGIPWMYFIILVFYIFNKYKFKMGVNINLKIFFYLTFFTMISALIFSNIMHYQPESYQFLYNITSVLLNTTLVICLVYFTINFKQLNISKYFKYLIYIALTIWIILEAKTVVNNKNRFDYSCYGTLQYEKYSGEYLLKVRETFINSHINKIGACLINYNKIPLKSMHFSNPIKYNLGDYLSLFSNNSSTISINSNDINMKKIRDINLMTFFMLEDELYTTLFYNYVNNQQAKNTYKSIEQSQIDFLDDYKMDFIIIQKGATVSDLIKNKIKTVIEDPKSGEKFCLLK